MRSVRGVGDVLATASVILVSVLAIATVWLYFSAFFAGATFSPQLSCLDLQTSSLFEIKSACQNADGEISVLVERNFDDAKIENINFVIRGENGASSYACGAACGDCVLMNLGETKDYFLSYGDEAEKVSIFVGDCLISETSVRNC